MNEARRRKELAIAQLRELELEEAKKTLVSAAEVEAEWTDLLATVRTKLLAIPSRVRQQAPELPQTTITLIDSLIRESLEELVAAEGEGDE